MHNGRNLNLYIQLIYFTSNLGRSSICSDLSNDDPHICSVSDGIAHLLVYYCAICRGRREDSPLGRQGARIRVEGSYVGMLGTMVEGVACPIHIRVSDYLSSPYQ